MSDNHILTTPSSLDQEPKQKIYLQGNDNSNTYNLYGTECDIYASKNSSEQRINASNKIKVNRLVNYEWEQRYTNGNLIAVHKSGLYFAYSIRIENNGKVRIFHKKLNEKVLLKSFKGRVVDLSFAHNDSQVLLGCVDETGCLQIFKITLDSDSKIQTSLIFHLLGQSPKVPFNGEKASLNESTTHRIIWCTYIPEQRDDDSIGTDDASKLFVLTRKNRAHIMNLDSLLQNYDCSQPLETKDLNIGHLLIDENKSTILTATFSPDGSAFATACTNGEVCIFKLAYANMDFVRTSKKDDEKLDDNEQLDDDNDEKKDSLSDKISPRCLKVWRPHENKSISSLYFLDDHKNSSPDAQFWSFILTGADYNREIKIWSCFKWDCIQTLNFYPSPLDDILLNSPSKSITNQNPLPCFKTSIDLTSKYLVMSDITRKCFYVLHLYQDIDAFICRCTAVSEYILAYPAVSFAIIDAQQIKAKKYNQLNNVTTTSTLAQTTSSTTAVQQDDLISLNDNNMSLSVNNEIVNTSISSNISLNPIPQLTNDQEQLVTVIRLYCIQTKQLQEMQIFLSGEQNISAFNNNSVSPPPPLIPLPSSTSSLQSTSLLQQLLPNHAINTQKSKQSLTLPLARQSQSMSLNSDIKSRVSDSHTSDYEQDNKKSVNKSASNQEASKFTEDSAIIQIVTPPIGISTLAAPILMTPDAFINSPNTRKSNEPNQQKMDILQSLLNSSVNTNQSQTVTNLLSSRTSSLTQVTNNTNIITSTNDVKPNSSLTKLNTNGSQKHLQKRRNRSSSSSSSTASSTSSTCSSCSSSSGMDQADKEIAALSSSNKSLKIKTKSKKQLNNKDNLQQDLEQEIKIQSDLLLNKVSIEDESTICKLNDEEPVIKQTWPNPPLSESNKSNNLNDTDLKTLLIQLTQAVRTQNEEIENLKKLQINTQLNFKNQMEMKQSSNNGPVSAPSQLTSFASDEQKLTLILQQTINNHLMPKLEKSIKEEINKSVQNQISSRILDPLREQLSRDLAEKIKSIENILKDNISKLFKSKTTIDTLSQSISNSMQGVIVNSYRETFQKLIVPNFEKSCQNMYQQVNNSFSKGTQDYLAEFEQLAKQQKKLFEENKDPLMSQLKHYTDQMHSHGKQVATDMANNLQQQFDNHLRSTNAILQDTIISSVKAIIKEEIQLAMRDQQHVLPDRLINYMRQSGTMTPVNLPPANSTSNLMSLGHSTNTQDIKTQINNFVSKGQLNSAFQVALCAADLGLLMNLCEKVPPSQVFELTVNSATKKTQCQLQQPVILSLIQQLSQDLNTNTELKVKYLEEAIVNLDLNNALTREHTPSVMNQLIMKLQQYVQAHPNDKMVKQMRMLLMASQSLLSQPKQLKTQQQLHSQHHDTF